MAADQTTTTDNLLRRAGRADREAFALLYDEVAPMVYGIALRVVRDRARAEEISQEAFLKIWDKAARYDPGRGSARAWIAAIAHRSAVDVVRSEAASRRCTLQVGARSLDASFDVVAESVERSEDRAAVERLTPVQRQAIDLAYFGGLTYREVAESLDRPLGTIKTRMRSALLALSDILGGNDQIGGRDG